MLRIRSCLSKWTKPIHCEKVWTELADWSKTICSNKSGHLCVCTGMSVSAWILWNCIRKLWLTRHFLEVEFERNCPRGFFWESNSTLHWLFVWIFHATAIQKNLRVTQDFVSLLVRVQATQLKEHLRVGTASNLDQRLTQGELLLPFLILSTKLYPNFWKRVG